MRSRNSFLAAIALPLAFSASALFAQGAKITIHRDDQTTVTGELLSVRDSALVIFTQRANTEDDLWRYSKATVVVRNQTIRRIVVKGRTKAGTGMFWGLIIGATTGVIIGLAINDSNDDSFLNYSAAAPFIGGIALGGAGLVVGTIGGAASTTIRQEIRTPEDFNFSSLRPLARFKEKEPDFLSKVKTPN